jgi:dipeptidyl aminopeptidase/acylaminoacyl peptidase
MVENPPDKESNPEPTPYLNWDPLLTPQDIFEDIIGLNHVFCIDTNLFWQESRPQEQGRVVLVKREEDGTIQDITPKEMYIRTRVHEYGGGAATHNTSHYYFVNFTDQRIYEQNLADPSQIRPLTPKINDDGSLGKYAALELSQDGKYLLFVYEKEYKDQENQNYLAFITLHAPEIREPTILHEGYDFYGTPTICPSCDRIAWLSWNHPNMPWEYTTLWLAEFRGGKLENPRKIVDSPTINVGTPCFCPEGGLFFTQDQAKIPDLETTPENDYRNWWNIWYWDPISNDTIPLTKECVEINKPMWGFGNKMFYFLNQDTILAIYRSKGRQYLCRIDRATGKLQKINVDITEFTSIGIKSDSFICLTGASPRTPSGLFTLDLNSRMLRLIKTCTELRVPFGSITIPQWFTFPTPNNSTAYGHLYLPLNEKFTPPDPDAEKPPLIMTVHGGPTGNAMSNFSFTTHFWTTQGFAVVDIDFHGSTGYGRAFRDSLYGQWGEIDNDDVQACVEYLTTEGYIDPTKCAIQGGSGGGYSVLRALTMFPTLFTAGACYFGVGNLVTLAKLTHKFESHYLDTLLGVTLKKDPDQIYYKRSPINFLGQIKAPMIIFQGADDKIVTPENSREITESLTKKGITNQYIEYPGEGHGFRNKKTLIDALTKHAAFFRKIFHGQ